MIILPISSLPHLYIHFSFKEGWENLLFELGRETVKWLSWLLHIIHGHSPRGRNANVSQHWSAVEASDVFLVLGDHPNALVSAEAYKSNELSVNQ